MIIVIGVGLCFSGLFGLLLAEASERFPAVAGSAFGGIMASGGIGGALLPWMVGIAASASLVWQAGLLPGGRLSHLARPATASLIALDRLGYLYTDFYCNHAAARRLLSTVKYRFWKTTGSGKPFWNVGNA